MPAKRKPLSQLSAKYRKALEHAEKRGATPYQERKLRGIRKGYTPSQAVGKPRKTELPIKEARKAESVEKGALYRRIFQLTDERPLNEHLSGAGLSESQVKGIIARINQLIRGNNTDAPTRAVAVALYRVAARDYWFNEQTRKREGFKRAESAAEPLRAMDMLLMLLTDLEAYTEHSEFTQGKYDAMAERLEAFEEAGDELE